jgi:hypothetical protein
MPAPNRPKGGLRQESETAFFAKILLYPQNLVGQELVGRGIFGKSKGNLALGEGKRDRLIGEVVESKEAVAAPWR